MEFAAKDKLARLEEDRQRRRKQRAADALLRIDAVGKQTLQLLQENALQRPGWSENPDGAAAQHEDGPDAGRLSRVLLEAAGSVEDPRRAARRNKRANRGLAQRAEERATQRRIDQARQSIESAIISTTGSGLKDGLEAAARQVHDVVSHVSTFARGVLGMPELKPDALDDLVTEEHGEDKAAKQPPVASLDATRETDPAAEFAPRDALGARGFEMTLDINKPPRDRDPDLIPASDRAAAAAPRDLLSRHRGIASFAAHRPLGDLEDKLQRPFIDTTDLNASLTAGLRVPGQTAGGSSPGILLDLTAGGHRPATPAGAPSDGKPADATARGNFAIQAQTEGQGGQARGNFAIQARNGEGSFGIEGQGGPGRGNFAIEAHAGLGERSTAINAQTDAAATGAAPRLQAQHVMAGPVPAVDSAAAGPQGALAAQGPQLGGPGAPALHAEVGIPGVATFHAQVGAHGAATFNAQLGGPAGTFPGQLGGPGAGALPGQLGGPGAGALPGQLGGPGAGALPGQLGGPGTPGAFPGQINAEVGIAAQPAGAVNAPVLPGRMHAGAIIARSSVESDIAGPEGSSGSAAVQRHSGAIV
ncbi:MAG TPA: hypothetical protein VFQ87_07615, partial [Bradyrhizobium sp.]|nr:hypothetical protein [Bradyrhizobium sp.]